MSKVINYLKKLFAKGVVVMFFIIIKNISAGETNCKFSEQCYIKIRQNEEIQRKCRLEIIQKHASEMQIVQLFS